MNERSLREAWQHMHPFSMPFGRALGTLCHDFRLQQKKIITEGAQSVDKGHGGIMRVRGKRNLFNARRKFPRFVGVSLEL
jgi:hypothetical protein